MDKDLRKKWYLRPDVLSNIVPCLKEKEVCFLTPANLQTDKRYPVRCIKAHHSSYLLRNMEAFDFFNRQYNLYHSVYWLQDMPMFSFSPLARSEQQHQFFKTYFDHVKNMDFVMDFDGNKNLPIDIRIEDAKRSALKVVKILQKFNIPFNIVFSGSKGFHVEVRDFPTTQDWKKRTKTFEDIAVSLVLAANGDEYKIFDHTQEDVREYLRDRYSFDSSIYTTTRIWKCPYSYDVTTDCIVYPLTVKELEDFKIEDYKADKLLNKTHWGVGLKKAPSAPMWTDSFWRMAEWLGVIDLGSKEVATGSQKVLEL